LVTTSDGYKSVAYDKFTAVLLEALREEAMERAALEARALEAEKRQQEMVEMIAALTARMDANGLD